VTAAIQNGGNKDVRTLLKRRVMQPMGVPDKEWSCGYGKTYLVNGLPLIPSWGGGNPRASATNMPHGTIPSFTSTASSMTSAGVTRMS